MFVTPWLCVAATGKNYCVRTMGYVVSLQFFLCPNIKICFSFVYTAFAKALQLFCRRIPWRWKSS